MSSRILLLSADFGSGHLSAANAIAALCRELDPTCEPEVVQVRSFLLSLIAWGYLRLIAWTPSLYRKLYHMPVSSGLRSLVDFVLHRVIQGEIARVRPAVIVATHPFPGGVAARLRHEGRLAAPVVMALTDFLPHGFWIHEGVDRYCVASESAAAQLATLGVEPNRITVTGVAIRPDFRGSMAVTEQPEPVHQVLVMGGGLGLGPIVNAVRSLAALPQADLRITVICGTNQPLRQELNASFQDDARIKIVGFTTAIADHMTQSALLVTKPGGITCSEAMAMGLPMLLLDPLPGHEEENAQYLTETGAALVTDHDRVGTQTSELLFTNPEQLRFMRQQALVHGHPRSAEAIANEILMLSVPNPHPKTTAC